MTRGKIKFDWTAKQKEAFENLRKAMTEEREEKVMATFDPRLPTEMRTDASKVGIGAVLVQYHKKILAWKPVAYSSRKLNAHQATRWIIPELEL